MMANQLIRALFVYSLALFYGFMVCFSLLLSAIRKLEIPRRGKRREKPPECLLDPELGEHHFLRTASNIRIHYVAKGDTGKPLMLCIHGFPEFWYSWRYQLKAFSDNFRMVAVDLRGYGESDSPKGREHYKTSLLVNDIKEIIEALDYKSCTLLSHDWGGALAWSFAHMHPEFVDKLIACNIPHLR
ncbi:epoxide hydrolase 4-like [Porites lutea]|uniref:epoxide hydrolase 4-like n=1 Tax=Porites lutea TaxID=51062 RepID=UPI003CC6CFE2